MQKCVFKTKIKKHRQRGGKRENREIIRNKEPTTYFILKTNRNHRQKAVFG